ncbi:MAG: cupin domain-containing protein [Clostridiales bacterium]|nr:cupin domain-containing protein [Clostridiales bacterium]
MKCLILAGGLGERLWPLSRRRYPKQFIELTQYHSVFQDTIARNMPYCDEFLIAAGSEHKNVIEDQLRAFQGLSYRAFYEDIPRRTTASVTMAMMSLEPSEFVLVVQSDVMIEDTTGYADAIVAAKALASEQRMVVFGKQEQDINSRFGYIYGDPVSFKEKPEDKSMIPDPHYRNLGMILVRAGVFLNELKRVSREVYDACRKAYALREVKDGDLVFGKDALSLIERISVERLVLEHSDKLSLVKSEFDWKDLTSLEDLEQFSYKNSGPTVTLNSEGTLVVNKSERKAVVVSGIKDAVVVNTDDAVYVGQRGNSSADDLKELLNSEGSDKDKIGKYVNSSDIHFRQWGYYKELEETSGHYVRHNYVRPGRTIYEHSHETRTENWIILSGKALVVLDGVSTEYDNGGVIEVKPGVKHQLSNPGDTILEFIATANGDDILSDDRQERKASNVGEIELGVKVDPILKLRPTFKEYIWGGSRLKTDFGMVTDMDKIAEAWVLSAHPDGQTRVINGRHRGMYLGKYIETVGKATLGWKCSSLRAFPLLVKLIDASSDLSVQVHPDDDYALENESSYGKNEMWYVIDSAPGSGLYVGFKRDVTRQEVEASVKDGTITDLLNFVPTKKGDVFFIPSGTVHAIGAGNLICEVQQSSNCTYRLYDYGRVDRYGNSRELHLEKALDVMDYTKYEPQRIEEEGNVICRCKYFEALVYDVDGEITVPADDSKFDAAVCIDGSGKIICADSEVSVSRGESVFLPASKDPIVLSGTMKVLMCHV